MVSRWGKGLSVARAHGVCLKIGAIALCTLVLPGSVYGVAASRLSSDRIRIDRSNKPNPSPDGELTFFAPALLGAKSRLSENVLPQASDSERNAYQVCVTSATAVRDAAWAAECKRIGEKDRQDYAECVEKLNLSTTYCGAAYRIRDVLPKCPLLPGVATSLNAALESARNRCLRESKTLSP